MTNEDTDHNDPKKQLERLVGYQSRVDLLDDFLDGKAESPEDQANVQSVVEGNERRRLGNEEVGNPSVYTPDVRSARVANDERASALYGAKKDEIIGALKRDDESKLAKLALGLLTPVEVDKDDIHNETATAHANYLMISELKGRVENGEEVKYADVIKAVKPFAEQDIDERLSEDANPDNQYLSDGARERMNKTMKFAILNTLERTGMGRQYLEYAVAAADAALAKRFPNGEADVVKYAEQTLRHMEDGDARKAIKKIYNVKLKE